MPTYQSNISLIGGLPSTWAAAAWIHPCTGARSALTPHWASAAACRRGTRPPQVFRTQGAKGCSRRTGPISQRRYSTADRLAREGYRGPIADGIVPGNQMRRPADSPPSPDQAIDLSQFLVHSKLV